MSLHDYALPAESDTLCLKAEPLLHAGRPRQPDAASGPQDAVPGQSGGPGGAQGPDHLARRARKPRRSGDRSVGCHPAGRNASHYGPDPGEPTPACLLSRAGLGPAERLCPIRNPALLIHTPELLNASDSSSKASAKLPQYRILQPGVGAVELPLNGRRIWGHGGQEAAARSCPAGSGHRRR